MAPRLPKPIEIERKFLLKHMPASLPERGQLIVQGYLSENPVVRVRTVKDRALTYSFLTVKGKGLLKRFEAEYMIPDSHAKEMFKIITSSVNSKVIHKTRYKIGRFEVDRFHGELDGLWLAEIELKHEKEKFSRPFWLGSEVTDDYMFQNVNLCRASPHVIFGVAGAKRIEMPK